MMKQKKTTVKKVMSRLNLIFKKNNKSFKLKSLMIMKFFQSKKKKRNDYLALYFFKINLYN